MTMIPGTMKPLNYLLQFNWILTVLLMMTVSVAKATFMQNVYKKMEPWQNISGKIRAELTVESKIECSIKCRGTKRCAAYKYRGTGPGNCLLMERNCSDHEELVFEQETDDIIFEKVHVLETHRWTGPKAALYQKFDTFSGLVLREGTEEVNIVSLVSGQVNCALTLNHTKSQWVDLGIHTEACMTQPETCGAAGGAISLWLSVIDCSDKGGILSSYSNNGTSGSTSSVIYCRASRMWHRVGLQEGFFSQIAPTPTAWTHVVLNYVGPNDGERIRIYQDGEQVASDTIKFSHFYDPSAGDDKIVVGRFYTNKDESYTSLKVDELILFNKALDSAYIELLHDGIY